MEVFSVPEKGKVKIDYTATIKLKGCAKVFTRLLKSKFDELGRTAMKGTMPSTSSRPTFLRPLIFRQRHYHSAVPVVTLLGASC